jgi:hypothetical protein
MWFDSDDDVLLLFVLSPHRGLAYHKEFMPHIVTYPAGLHTTYHHCKGRLFRTEDCSQCFGFKMLATGSVFETTCAQLRVGSIPIRHDLAGAMSVPIFCSIHRHWCTAERDNQGRPPQ